MRLVVRMVVQQVTLTLIAPHHTSITGSLMLKKP